jgi:hypothetical protein
LSVTRRPKNFKGVPKNGGTRELECGMGGLTTDLQTPKKFGD